MEKRYGWVKDWFVRKNYEGNQLYAIRESGNQFVITDETEKAYKGYYDTDYGKIYAWCPKSCCEA